MEINFFLSLIVSGFISIYAFYISIRSRSRSQNVLDVRKGVFLLGLVFFIVTILNLAWTFGASFLEEDLMLVIASMYVLTTILLLYSIFKLTRLRSIVYLFLLYVVVLLSINDSLNMFFILTVGISNIILLVIFLEVLLIPDTILNEMAASVIGFSITSLLYLGLIYTGVLPSEIFWFIPLLFLLTSFFFLNKEILTFEEITKKSKRKHSSFYQYVKLMFFVMAFMIFLLISSAAIHEMGHAMVAKYYGCEQHRAILFDLEFSPHTEIFCSNNYNQTFITLAGLFATVLVALLFYLSRTPLTMHISYALLAFSLILSQQDIIGLGFSSLAAASISFLGILVALLVCISISYYYLHTAWNRKE